ncbi:MAG: RNA polymerase sigma factor [Oscillospiraceae bacterium]|nr:RNA polymerase sigma factor [Oscillospiraceae bacterium]
MTESSFAKNIALITQGDMQGLKAIYEEYGKMIYSSVLSLCRDTHTAEDVTSEFFLRLKTAASVYREGLGHKKWLLISARNLAIDILRKKSREIPSSASDGDEESHPLSDIPDSMDAEGMVTSRMAACQLLMSLPEDKREVVHLKIYCGLTFSEIADLLRIPAGTAAWRYSQGIKQLRRLYKEVL